MKLKTQHREEIAGVLKGTKHYYIAGTVEFNEEEKSIIQERGLYDSISVSVPAGMPSTSRTSDFRAMLIRAAGVIIILVGTVASCGNGMMNALDGGHHHTQFLLSLGGLAVGIALFTFGKMKDWEADKRDANYFQTLTIRQLLSKPSFLMWAATIQDSRTNEEIARNQFSMMSEQIRTSVSVSEDNTYEL